MKGNKKIATAVLALMVTGCSTSLGNLNSLSTGSKSAVVLTDSDIKQLDKEYSAFTTKSFSQAYLDKKLNMWMDKVTNGATPEIKAEGEVQLAKELLFAQLKHPDLAKDPTNGFFAKNNTKYQAMLLKVPVLEKMWADSSFATFMGSTSKVPGNLRTDKTATSFTANWDTVNGATSYDIIIDGVLPAINVESGTSYEKTGLTTGTTHTWKVRANTASYSSAYSAEQSVNIVAAPTVPAGFKLVVAGPFSMGMTGVSGTTPVHTVTFTNDLYVAKYEVKQGEWASVYDFAVTYDSEHSTNYSTLMVSKYPSYFDGTANTGYNPELSSRDNLPVEKVSWWMAIAYCNAKSLKDGLNVAYDPASGSPTGGFLLNGTGVNGAIGSVTTDTAQVTGYRLPTQAEWEYAARGGKDNWNNGNLFSGSNTALGDDVAWNMFNSGSKSHEVGGKAPNELGLYDMSGNVSEWSTDSYTNTYGTATNPYIAPHTTPPPFRFARSGSYTSSPDKLYSVAFEGSNYPTATNSFIGFRIVRTVP